MLTLSDAQIQAIAIIVAAALRSGADQNKDITKAVQETVEAFNAYVTGEDE